MKTSTKNEDVLLILLFMCMNLPGVNRTFILQHSACAAGIPYGHQGFYPTVNRNQITAKIRLTRIVHQAHITWSAWWIPGRFY